MLNYPLVCWNLPDNYVLGCLIGTDYQLIDSNIKKLKSKFTEKLKKEQEDGSISEPVIKDYVLKIFHVKVQPTYNQPDGVFPTVTSLNLSVPAVYGEQEYGYYKCFLPFFGYSFYFYNVNQINNLVEHFVKDLLKSYDPETIHRYLLLSEPRLEHITIREKKKENDESSGIWTDQFNTLKILDNIAERMPPGNEQKKLKFFPETAWEQSEKVKNVISTIFHEKANTLIVGEQGVGKSVIILEAIRKIHNQRRIDQENSMTFWKTTSHRMISGARYLGDWQKICENLIGELQYANGVLWVIDFVNLFTLGGDAPEDSIAAFLQPFLQQGNLQIISEISLNELEAARRFLPGFTENFQTIHIEEMKQQKMLKVLSLFSEYAEKNFKIQIEKQAIELCYRLLNRYIKYENFPGKAVKFLNHCLNDAYFKEQNAITKEHVLDAFIERTGLPGILLRDEETLDNDELMSFFSKKIIGQEDALEKICSVVKIFKTGLNDPNKPIATMLFAGSTGVGKTESAKVLAKYFFSKDQKKDPFIRLDMSEFQYPEQIARLIGSGKTEPGKFIRLIREKPFSVLLFDEIEKANPVMFDILLNILDEGILIDVLGRITDFRNTIIIMTTNLGSEQKNSIGFNSDKNKVFNPVNQIKSFFRPEFFNRIDYLVNFNSLDVETIKNIVSKELEEVMKRDGFVKRNIKLQYSDQLVSYLSENGFDVRYGARPLQRTIENLLISKLSKYLLQKPNLKSCLLQIDFIDDEVKIFQEK